jgi:hypothetical protein
MEKPAIKIDFWPDAAEDDVVRRAASILLLIALGAVCSGALGFFHQLDYQRQLTRWMSEHHAAGSPAPIPFSGHDESSCLICLVLHLPMSAGFVQVTLAGLGILAIAKILAQPAPVLSRLTRHIACRGPPIA